MQADLANVKQRILVLGAGELGLAVLQGLATQAGEHDVSLSVLLRPQTVDSQVPAKRAELDNIREWGVAIEPADLINADVSALAEIFERFDTVISCVGFAAGAGTQRKLCDAALQAGVKRFVPWQFGVDYDLIGRGSPQDLFDEQLDVRDRLRAQERTGWIIISTGMFTSFLFEPLFGVVDRERGRVNALGSLETAVTVTTAEDIGRLTAAIVLHQPHIVDQVVYTAGDTLTYGELAALLERVTHKPFKAHAWSVEQLQADLARSPDDQMSKYRAVFALGRGVAWDKAQTFNHQQGITVTSAEQWALANLSSH